MSDHTTKGARQLSLLFPRRCCIPMESIALVAMSRDCGVVLGACKYCFVLHRLLPSSHLLGSSYTSSSPFTILQSAGGYCTQCIPPAAPNAVNPAAQAGVAAFTWTCAAGFYGTPVTRQCSALNGAWSPGAITCYTCSPPSPTSHVSVSKVAADTWRYQCSPGASCGACYHT